MEGKNYFVDRIAMFSKALQINPKFDDSLEDLGSSFYDSDKFFMAQNFLKLCLRIKPDKTRAKDYLSKTLEAIQRDWSSLEVSPKMSESKITRVSEYQIFVKRIK